MRRLRYADFGLTGGRLFSGQLDRGAATLAPQGYAPLSFGVSWGNRDRSQMFHPEHDHTRYTRQRILNLQRELHRVAVVEGGFSQSHLGMRLDFWIL